MDSKLIAMLSPIECRQYRYALGMTCDDIASVMNITRQEISAIETGKNTKPSTVKYLSIVLLLLWDDIPDSEKTVRMECAKLGIRYGTPAATRITRILNP